MSSLKKSGLGALVAVIGTVPQTAIPATGDESATSHQDEGTSVREMGTSAVVDGASVVELRREVADRFAGYGHDVSPEDILVYEVEGAGRREYVATADPELAASIRLGPEGEMGYQISVPRRGADAQSAIAAASWVPVYSVPSCAARMHEDGAWFDVCAVPIRLEGETDKSYDYYGLHHYGTGNNAWHLGIYSGRAECCPFPYDAWIDWAPKSDSEYDQCVDGVAAGLSYIAEFSFTNRRCEFWGINKGEDPGVFSAIWRSGGPGIGGPRQTDREVAYATAGAVKVERTPTWWVSSFINRDPCGTTC